MQSALIDPAAALTPGLAAIRRQYQVPADFSPEVLAAAEEAAKRPIGDRKDLTALPFVTLDPAESTDLDQAFTIERSGSDLILRYAIADVAHFVDDGGPIDLEAWNRGETLYLPDNKAPLYPPILSQGAASLLPDGPRPAVVYSVRVAPDGKAVLDGAERAIIQNRAKLAYESAADTQLPPGFAQFADRIAAAEEARGTARIDLPEQEVTELPNGSYELTIKPPLITEKRNAALSLAANMAIADALLAHDCGLFRVMADPDPKSVDRLRNVAKGLGINWGAKVGLCTFERTLDPTKPKHAALMSAIHRAGGSAGYAAWVPGIKPWHAAMAATYTHATAPLRRLADRYVGLAALSVAKGEAVPDYVTAAFARLPDVMAKAEARSGQISRSVIDLAEAVCLQKHIGDSFDAVVTSLDERGARFQLETLPIVARADAHNVAPGHKIHVQLISADPIRREVRFERKS